MTRVISISLAALLFAVLALATLAAFAAPMPADEIQAPSSIRDDREIQAPVSPDEIQAPRSTPVAEVLC